MPQPPSSPAPSRPPSTPSPPPAAPGRNPRDGGAVDPLGGGNCPDVDTLLNRTNVYRARHQALALTWSASLAAASAAYAQKLADGGCTLKHSGGRDYGENLMMIQGSPKPDSTCTVAAKGWYGEVRDYDFDAAQPFADNWSKRIGHFTQLVWRGTSSMGCGVGMADAVLPIGGGRTLAGGCKIIVCRYRAPGNVASDMAFLRNVLRNTTEVVV
ncbi:hypothetical protein PLESTF_001938700 [Pleodorina starrii]|nr:hypothetical protein PLESTF_001938700 [Pleodorina starrii]